MDFHSHSQSHSSAPDTTAPGPPLPPEDPSSFRWLQPGEILAIPVPTVALQLDALLRHLEIDGEFGDWPAATIHLAQARATWLRLEPTLHARVHGKTHLCEARRAAKEMARALDAAVVGVRAASRDQVIGEARRAIAQVAAIERVFE
jgi:hypothetical protein